MDSALLTLSSPTKALREFNKIRESQMSNRKGYLNPPVQYSKLLKHIANLPKFTCWIYHFFPKASCLIQQYCWILQGFQRSLCEYNNGCKVPLYRLLDLPTKVLNYNETDLNNVIVTLLSILWYNLKEITQLLTLLFFIYMRKSTGLDDFLTVLCSLIKQVVSRHCRVYIIFASGWVYINAASSKCYVIVNVIEMLLTQGICFKFWRNAS